MYVALNALQPTDTETLRVCVSGGSALPIEVLRDFESKYGCEILEGYGLSETSPVACFNQRGARKPGSIGVPVPGVSMRVHRPRGQRAAFRRDRRDRDLPGTT